MLDSFSEQELQLNYLCAAMKRSMPVAAELNSLPFEERLPLALAAIERLSTERLENKSIPLIMFKTALDSRGRRHLLQIDCITFASSAVVYELPGTISKQSLADEMKLNLDAAHSRRLKTQGLKILMPLADLSCSA